VGRSCHHSLWMASRFSPLCVIVRRPAVFPIQWLIREALPESLCHDHWHTLWLDHRGAPLADGSGSAAPGDGPLVHSSYLGRRSAVFVGLALAAARGADLAPTTEQSRTSVSNQRACPRGSGAARSTPPMRGGRCRPGRRRRLTAGTPCRDGRVPSIPFRPAACAGRSVAWHSVSNADFPA
jgi:hypothetical protein